MGTRCGKGQGQAGSNNAAAGSTGRKYNGKAQWGLNTSKRVWGQWQVVADTPE